MTNPSQAWAILHRHARDEIEPLRLQELCLDNDRVSSLVAVHSKSVSAEYRINLSTKNSSTNKHNNNKHGHNHIDSTSSKNSRDRVLIVDVSRQRITLETLNHLLRLASAVDLTGFIQTLAWGQNNRFDPYSCRNTHKIGENHESSWNHYHQNEALNLTLSPTRSVSSYKQTRFAKNNNISSVSLDDNDNNSVRPSSFFTTSPSMHLALRAPTHADLSMLTSTGTNALDEIHSTWSRIQLISQSIRKGQWRSATGQTLNNILLIGRGVAFQAVQFIYHSLQHDPQILQNNNSPTESNSNTFSTSFRRNTSSSTYFEKRTLRFLSSLDVGTMACTLNDWNPEETLVISLVLTGTSGDDVMSGEILSIINSVKRWLLWGIKAKSSNVKIESIWSKQMFLVTSNDTLYHSNDITGADSAFLIPSYARCEAFSTFTAAGLLPVSILFGWDVVQEIINGAHDMDSHFVETNPRHNLPVILALVDLWNDAFLSKSCGAGKIVNPFMNMFGGYPSLMSAIEAQVCSGRCFRNKSNHIISVGGRDSPSGIVIDGGLGGSYDRAVYQGDRVPPSELIISMTPQSSNTNLCNILSLPTFNGEDDGSLNIQDHLIASFFAHADLLAFGNGSGLSKSGGALRSMEDGSISAGGLDCVSFDGNIGSFHTESNHIEGNRPSTLLICGKFDPFTCGQLLALSEHRALVTARLWDVDQASVFGSSHASVLRTKQTEITKEKLSATFQHLDIRYDEADDDNNDDDGFNNIGPKLNFSTTTILGHYATHSQNHRLHHNQKR